MRKPSKTKNPRTRNGKRIKRIATTYQDQAKRFMALVGEAVQKYGSEEVTPEVVNNVNRAVRRAFNDCFEPLIKDRYNIDIILNEKDKTFSVEFVEKKLKDKGKNGTN